MWYTTADARRDAEKQAANQRDDRQSPNCSSFCARGEPCSITDDGKCDAACDSAMPANTGAATMTTLHETLKGKA